MITATDIANILYKDCLAFGIDCYQGDNAPAGEISKERIVIHSKPLMPEKYWRKSFPEINICVPDNKKGQSQLIRLNELDRMSDSILDGVVGQHDGSNYSYSISSKGVESDTQLKCHYVNVKILFEILNVK